MENKPTILKYLSKVFMIYGITVLILNIFVLLFGEKADEMSTIFSFGSNALAVKTNLQFLLATFLLVSLETLFMTDAVIKKMKMPLRICMMFLSIFATVMLFVTIFGWFPTNMAMPWILFIICFVACSTVSTLISAISERQENKKLEDALKRYKGEENDKSN